MANYDGRHGGDRWRDRDQGNWNRDRDYGRSDYRGRGGRESYGGYRGSDDRGFFDRAGDEVRSWFGDDEAQRRREEDERRWAREHDMTGRRDNDTVGSGWGNQSGESWNRARPGERFSDYSAAGGMGYGSGYGASEPEYRGGFGFGDHDRGRSGHDPHYAEWRRRQIDDLDRDYDDYRREHQSKFEQDFGSWRSKRQGQRQSLNKVAEHMDVVGFDGSHVGTVDKVRGDRIILTRSDPDAGGIHHSIPCSWVETVDDKVMLNRSADDAKHAWRNEERGRALFERGGSDEGEGPHNLNRSFAGTYDERSDRDRDS
ncbi:MAG TPA: DUF2171 domain-containing protein [Allosphingosinicella sp.]